MCGIAGILYRDADRTVELELLRAMANAIAHRGPDAEGLWQTAGIGLAHRRLSIIDLAGGDQPLANEDSSVQVVFNGEIYNYRELRGGPLREAFESLVLAPDSRIDALLDQRGIRHIYNEHLAGWGCSGNVLWAILVLARWVETYLSPSPSQTEQIAMPQLSVGVAM